MTTAQPQSSADGMLAQILLKQGEMSTQLAVMTKILESIPDHETRIRSVEAALPPHLEERLGVLETTRAKMIGVAAAVSVISSAGGTWVGLIITRR